MSIEFIPLKEVSRELQTHPDKVIKMILNQTLPIGAVSEGNRRTIRIPRVRWEKWKAGERI